MSVYDSQGVLTLNGKVILTGHQYTLLRFRAGEQDLDVDINYEHHWDDVQYLEDKGYVDKEQKITSLGELMIVILNMVGMR